MKISRNIFYLFLLISIFTLSEFIEYSAAIDQKSPNFDKTILPDNKVKKPPKDFRRLTKQKPDLIVASIKIESQVLDAERLQHTIELRLENQGLLATSDSVSKIGTANNSRGRYKAIVEWTSDDRTYTRLCEFTVEAMSAGASRIYPCGIQIISRGVFRRYRARTDYLNWINETNENNNEKYEGLIVP